MRRHSTLNIAQAPAAQRPHLQESVAALNRDGTPHLREGRVSQALEAFGRLTEVLPDSQWAWDRLGMAHAEAGRDRDALESFRKVVGTSLRKGRSAVPHQAVAAHVALGEDAAAARILGSLVPEGEVEPELARLRRELRPDDIDLETET
ncbi:MAG: hypothetical protein AAGD06_33160 [Acidobacteriota bacterium]